MRLKISKQELENQLLNVRPYVPTPDFANISPNDIGYQIQDMILKATQDALSQAFTILLDNIYTEEEFENDIGLTK